MHSIFIHAHNTISDTIRPTLYISVYKPCRRIWCPWWDKWRQQSKTGEGTERAARGAPRHPPGTCWRTSGSRSSCRTTDTLGWDLVHKHASSDGAINLLRTCNWCLRRKCKMHCLSFCSHIYIITSFYCNKIC